MTGRKTIITPMTGGRAALAEALVRQPVTTVWIANGLALAAAIMSELLQGPHGSDALHVAAAYGLAFVLLAARVLFVSRLPSADGRLEYIAAELNMPAGADGSAITTAFNSATTRSSPPTRRRRLAR